MHFQNKSNKPAARISLSEKTEAELEETIRSKPEAFNSLLNSLSETILKSIKQQALHGGLDAIRQSRADFNAHNYNRWKNGFDSLELLIEICIEAGANFNNRLRPAAVESGDILFDTLARLHAKACIVAKEVACLLNNGYADGGHSRWRALHEITVTSKFLADNGLDTAERYVAHEAIDSYKGARLHKEYEQRLQAVAPSSQVLDTLKARFDDAISLYGSDFSYPYGWASHAAGKKNVNFSDLEKAVALDHWRPYYKWASQNIHASAKTINFSLGLTETDSDLLLVGPSNAGMTDPAHSTAISISQTTINLLCTSPSLNDLIIVNIIIALSNEVGNSFLKIQTQQET